MTESPVATKFVKRDDEFWRNVDEVSKKVRANPEIYGDHRRPKIMESKDEPVGGTEQKGTCDEGFHLGKNRRCHFGPHAKRPDCEGWQPSPKGTCLLQWSGHILPHVKVPLVCSGWQPLPAQSPTEPAKVPFSSQAVADGYWEIYHDDDCGSVVIDGRCTTCGWRPDMQSLGARSSAVQGEAGKALVLGEPCPKCGSKYLGEMGDGEYSCVACGMGMKEPCEHWKQILPAVHGEAGKP